MDDLFQIGCIGLIKAIDNFDLSHNVRFSTYAVPMILGEVKRYLRDNNSVRIARSIKDIAYKTIRLKDELTTKNGIEPTNAEIAKLLEVDEIDVVMALDSLKDPVSMFEPIYNDGGDTIYLSDQLEDKKDNINSWDINIFLKDALEKLKEKERKILVDRYLMGKTQVEISDEIGISQAQVSRLEKDAISNIKRLIKWFLTYNVMVNYMKLSELQKKDIIDVTSGVKVGNIIDVMVEDNGTIISLIVDRNFGFNFFSSKSEIEVYFKDIIKIGEDVVLIKLKNNQ